MAGSAGGNRLKGVDWSVECSPQPCRQLAFACSTTTTPHISSQWSYSNIGLVPAYRFVGPLAFRFECTLDRIAVLTQEVGLLQLLRRL